MFWHVLFQGTLFGAYPSRYAAHRDLGNYGKDARAVQGEGPWVS
jgi:hypothetical protein